MRLIISIEMDNAAFDESPTAEVYRILCGLATRIAKDGAGAFAPYPLRDSNGNTVGFARVED